MTGSIDNCGKWRFFSFLALAAFASASLITSHPLGATDIALASTGPPNIVLIVTDDQRFDALGRMPQVKANITDHGVKFDNMIVDNPWCCPSRASILTGQRSHTTKVWNNNPPYGGFPAFQDDSTIATWLRDAGYRTALVGKYFSGYEKSPSYVPQGWDIWRALTYRRYAYTNYKVSENGLERYYGTRAADYKTDVLADYADSFIRSTSSTSPLFLYFAPNAPHVPATPAGKYSTSNLNLPSFKPPSYNEADMTDKPAYMRGLPQLTSTSNPLATRKKQYKALLSVDDAVAQLTRALADTGRLDNTVIVYTSDNGYLWGEHRWLGTTGGKVVPYIESLRVPFIVRYDPLTSVASTDSHLVSNIDIAPTLAELAGVTAPGAEGASMVPFLSGRDDPAWRQDTLIEHVQDASESAGSVPTYCGVHSDRFTYVVYATGEKELYDHTLDPFELNNVADDPAYAAAETEMHARLLQLCDPVPPGMTLSPAP